MNAAPASAVGDGAVRSLDPRVIPLRRTVGLIMAAIVGGLTFFALVSVGLVLWLSGDIPAVALLFLVLLWMVGMGLLFWYVYRWPTIAYRYTSYRVDAQGIEIHRGVFWRSVTSIPVSRVQHTDVSQGPLERSHGLGTLIVHTAGTDFARVMLSGLDHAVALEIREHLLPSRDQADAV